MKQPVLEVRRPGEADSRRKVVLVRLWCPEMYPVREYPREFLPNLDQRWVICIHISNLVEVLSLGIACVRCVLVADAEVDCEVRPPLEVILSKAVIGLLISRKEARAHALDSKVRFDVPHKLIKVSELVFAAPSGKEIARRDCVAVVKSELGLVPTLAPTHCVITLVDVGVSALRRVTIRTNLKPQVVDVDIWEIARREVREPSRHYERVDVSTIPKPELINQRRREVVYFGQGDHPIVKHNRTVELRSWRACQGRAETVPQKSPARLVF